MLWWEWMIVLGLYPVFGVWIWLIWGQQGRRIQAIEDRFHESGINLHERLETEVKTPERWLSDHEWEILYTEQGETQIPSTNDRERWTDR